MLNLNQNINTSVFSQYGKVTINKDGIIEIIDLNKASYLLGDLFYLYSCLLARVAKLNEEYRAGNFSGWYHNLITCNVSFLGGLITLDDKYQELLPFFPLTSQPEHENFAVSVVATELLYLVIGFVCIKVWITYWTEAKPKKLNIIEIVSLSLAGIYTLAIFWEMKTILSSNNTSSLDDLLGCYLWSLDKIVSIITSFILKFINLILCVNSDWSIIHAVFDPIFALILTLLKIICYEEALYDIRWFVTHNLYLYLPPYYVIVFGVRLIYHIYMLYIKYKK